MHPAWLRCSSDFEEGRSVARDNARDRRIAVEHGQCLASAHFPQMMAEVRL